MLTKEQLRKADFLTSILLLLFGLWVLVQAFHMPMRDTYGGVTNVWYVSPALFPLIVGTSLVLLSVTLLVHSIKTGGATEFLHSLKTTSRFGGAGGLRFFAILLAIGSFVYLFIPRIDFYLSIAIFLVYFIVAFYFDTDEALRKFTLLYSVIVAAFTLLTVSGLAVAMNGLFPYSMDVLALLSLIVLVVIARRLTGEDVELRRRYRISMAVAFATPTLLAPVFRYLLLVPLPREGGIIQLMHLVYYSIR